LAIRHAVGVRRVLGAFLAVALAGLAGCGGDAAPRNPGPQPAPQAADPCAPSSPFRQAFEREAARKLRQFEKAHPNAHIASNSGCASIRVPTGSQGPQPTPLAARAPQSPPHRNSLHSSPPTRNAWRAASPTLSYSLMLV
jgi:hypothetical protein